MRLYAFSSKLKQVVPAVVGAACWGRRYQSTTTTGSGTGSSAAGTAAAPTYEAVWALWNEGNLFSLSVVQIDGFLSANRVAPDASKKKAVLVRQVEEFLQRKESAAKGTPPPTPSPPAPQSRHGGGDRGGHGAWAPVVPVSQPETLLDLSQTGFYDTPHAMAPKAYQLLVSDATPDVVVSRVNTTSFPSFAANSECYTLSSADAALALRTRFSKAFQWCVLNMANLRLDAEFQADFGKLLVHDSVIKKQRHVMSAYSLQQRMQVQAAASQWVSAIGESSIPTMEALLADELFAPVGRKQVAYDVHVRRAKDVLALEMNSKAQVTAVHNLWHHVQTTHVVNANAIDARMLLRTRQALRRQDVELMSTVPILKLENDDISVVLPPEQGQVIYVSENDVRRWEKRQTMSGARFSIVETRRQPLIVLKDEEEDVRVEYQLIVSIPSMPTEKVDLRTLSLELYDITKLFADALGDGFVSAFGCEPQPVIVTTPQQKA